MRSPQAFAWEVALLLGLIHAGLLSLAVIERLWLTAAIHSSLILTCALVGWLVPSTEPPRWGQLRSITAALVWVAALFTLLLLVHTWTSGGYHDLVGRCETTAPVHDTTDSGVVTYLPSRTICTP